MILRRHSRALSGLPTLFAAPHYAGESMTKLQRGLAQVGNTQNPLGRKLPFAIIPRISTESLISYPARKYSLFTSPRCSRDRTLGNIAFPQLSPPAREHGEPTNHTAHCHQRIDRIMPHILPLYSTTGATEPRCPRPRPHRPLGTSRAGDNHPR